MVNFVEGALYIGSAAILYKGVTQQKILSEEKIRHGAIGALAGLVLGPKLEEIIRGDGSISDEAKRQILFTLSGAVVGGGLGNMWSRGAGDYLKDQLRNYSKKDK